MCKKTERERERGGGGRKRDSDLSQVCHSILESISLELREGIV